MTLVAIAEKLKTTKQKLERESLQALLEKKHLAINAKLVRLAVKYGVQGVSEFERAVKKGRIRESNHSLNDFFEFDHLEAERKNIQQLLKNV